MSKELIISSTRHETRVAVLEDDQLVEIYHQREKEYSLAGSIHKGRVTRVLPGMQSAFVDIGLERDAFLYVSDFFEDNEEYDKIVTSVEEKILRLEKGVPAQATVPPPADLPATVETVSATQIIENVPENGIPTPQASTTPAPDRSPEDREARDRRGRRSRRRRPKGGGGRGLPESKYYSPRVEEQPQPAKAEPTEPTRPAADDDFAVLPGESLAKYSQKDDPSGAEESETGEDLTVGERDAGDWGELRATDRAESLDQDQGGPVRNLAVNDEPAIEMTEDEEPPVDPAGPEAQPEPGAMFAADSSLQNKRQGYEDSGNDLSEAPEPDRAEVEEEAREDAEESNVPEGGMEGRPAEVEPLGDTTAVVEAPEYDTATPEHTGEPETDLPGTAQNYGEEDEPEAAEQNQVEPARIPTSLTATLREQGPRYQHRVSRRMRRKMRSGGPEERRPETARPEPRTEQQHRPEQQRSVARPTQPSISDLLREGQEIIVQIAKEPLGQKGARITSHIALPGRYLVYMPTVDHIGVSRKIASDEERSRLKRVLQANRSGIPGGYIVRTAGEGKTEEELRADMMFLYNLWMDLRQKAEKKPAPALVHYDLDVVQRILRDQLTAAFKNIWVDNEELYENVLRFVQRFQPSLVSRVKMYTRSNPVFDEFGITSELEKALRPKVWLKSGGYIVLNQTEALVAIDVNTGKYVGKSNRLEDTIVKTNTDAIREIVRQIRLRDLGGIIVIDFIDMDERKNRQKVMQALEEAMRADRAPYKILQFNDFGLVAITRKRVKQSLERTLCSPCPYCEGAGYVKSVGTVVTEIIQEAHKIAGVVEGPDVTLRVAPDVAKLLKSNQNDYLQELEEILKRTVIVRSDPLLHQERFDLA
jgi:ribonuclease G